MITEIREPLKVGAVFSRGKVRIRWLIWRGKKIDIEKATFSWRTREGVKDLYNFALSTGTEVFEISFHPADLTWYLEKIHLP